MVPGTEFPLAELPDCCNRVGGKVLSRIPGHFLVQGAQQGSPLVHVAEKVQVASTPVTSVQGTISAAPRPLSHEPQSGNAPPSLPFLPWGLHWTKGQRFPQGLQAPKSGEGAEIRDVQGPQHTKGREGKRTNNALRGNTCVPTNGRFPPGKLCSGSLGITFWN